MVEFYSWRHFFFYYCVRTKLKYHLDSKIEKMRTLWGKTQKTTLSFFTQNIPIRQLWTNLYHKEDHFLKIWPLLHYFTEIYLKICNFVLFLKKIFCLLKKNMSIYFFPMSSHDDLGHVHLAVTCLLLSMYVNDEKLVRDEVAMLLWLVVTLNFHQAFFEKIRIL